jgi:hypothetical protein
MEHVLVSTEIHQQGDYRADQQDAASEKTGER